MKRNFLLSLLPLLAIPLSTLVIPIQPSSDDQTLPPPDPRLVEITVSVLLEKADGKPASGSELTVCLCTEKIKPALERIRKSGRLMAKKIGPFDALYGDLKFMNSRAESARVSPVKPEADGRFTLFNIEKGTYYLYAGYLSDSCAGYWLLPLSVESAEPISITLNNANAAEMLFNQ